MNDPMQPTATRPDACRVLVTGANGFVGSALLQTLHAHRDWTVTGAVRDAARAASGQAQQAVTSIGDIGPATDWSQLLADVQAIVHTAARVHLMSDAAADPRAEYRRVNVDGTLASPAKPRQPACAASFS